MSIATEIQRLKKRVDARIVTAEGTAKAVTYIAYMRIADNDGTTVQEAVEWACAAWRADLSTVSPYIDWQLLQARYDEGLEPTEPDA